MKNLRHLTLLEIESLMTTFNEKKFRAKQIYEWIWKHDVSSIDEMLNLSKSLRDQLKSDFILNTVVIDHTQFSEDKTIKTRFKLYDGNFVEGVLIPSSDRMTACVSSQVGCSLSCKFCATGFMERKRNLHYDEIYDQVFLLNKLSLENYGKKLTNIVYMGMGEPLLNYKNVLQSIEKISSPDGLFMSPSRITVSTAGIANMIKKLADDEVKFNLALSLHAADDIKRSKIMPINDTNNLETLTDALNYYYQKTKNIITFEYILFANLNDSIEDAESLIKLSKKIPSKINIIEYNPVEFTDFVKPTEDKVQQFINYLLKHKVNTRLRRSRGKDIDAACGQLANTNKILV